uniref:Uncharacterized protein n=1 Tax=Brassica oleracea TaxID=3712 RepID=A0A3P6B433_BRAOL|nr:unnamed protein product [Brassica oleracea]
MVLIFHSFKIRLLILDMYFLYLSNFSLIFSVFKPFERFWRCRFFRSGFGYT